MAEGNQEHIDAIQNILGNEQQLREISDNLFEKNDTDKTGFIERGEFLQIVNDFSNSMGIPTPSEGEVNDIISALDSNNDGKFNKSEFSVFVKLLLEALLESVKQA